MCKFESIIIYILKIVNSVIIFLLNSISIKSTLTSRKVMNFLQNIEKTLYKAIVV